MSKEKIKYQSSEVVLADENSNEIVEIARKRGIKVPSTHLGFFKTVYARLEDSNKNGIRLARNAVDQALPGLVGSQVNFEHLRAGFVCGTILDAWINEKDEIIVVYSFFKSIYPEEYDRSLELMKEGTLAVSFELLTDRESKEFLQDGTIRLNSIDFQGMGHLMDNPPAEPTARVYEFAKRCKERLANINREELVCASQIEKACDDVLSQTYSDDEPVYDTPIFIVTTNEDQHSHVAELNWDGNGQTISGHGEGKHSQPHMIRNWQVQTANSTISDEPHAHRILDSVMAEIKNRIKDKKKTDHVSKNEKMEETTLNEEEKKKVDAIREELGNIVKDVADKDLLNEETVAEFRQKASEAKAEAEAKKATEDAELQEAKTRIEELESEVEKLKSALESKNSEIEAVRVNAEKIATLKIELKSNPHVKDFSDEDYLDEEKVERAKEKKEFDDLKEENKALKKAQEEAVKASEDAGKDNEKEDMDAGHQKEEKEEDAHSILRNRYVDRK